LLAVADRAEVVHAAQHAAVDDRVGGVGALVGLGRRGSRSIEAVANEAAGVALLLAVADRAEVARAAQDAAIDDRVGGRGATVSIVGGHAGLLRAGVVLLGAPSRGLGLGGFARLLQAGRLGRLRLRLGLRLV